MQDILNKIQRRFNQAASHYDRNSSLHRKIADELFSQVQRGPMPSTLLDVGCGTGYLTCKLKGYFPQSEITGLDFSSPMLELARSKNENINWVLADVNNLHFPDGNFEMLVSNLAYQWAGDLVKAFSEARRVLKPNGGLICTLFGFNTCQELFQSLDEATNQTLQFTRLANKSQIHQSLIASGFDNPLVDVEDIKVEFGSMQELLAWLKSIGANNLSREGFLGSDALSRAASIYSKKFSYLKGVGATFEVIRVYAKS